MQSEYMCMHDKNHLLYIKFDNFNQNIFISSALIIAQPEFNVVCGGLGKLLAEPRWRVEATTGTGATTATAIPERVMGIDSALNVISTPCVTEIILTNKWRNISCVDCISLCTWAYITVSMNLI